MPNITVIRSRLFEAIGRSYTDEEFDDVCFEFGVEIDDVMTETVEVFSMLQLNILTSLINFFLVYRGWY